MNYCRKCQSDYEKPGTCNCFADKAPRDEPVPVTPQPAPYPYYPLYPCYPAGTPAYPWWLYQTTYEQTLTVKADGSIVGPDGVVIQGSFT